MSKFHTPAKLSTLIDYISYILLNQQWQLSVAESCTAGQLAAALTAEPGASDWFAGGIVAYTEEAKMNLLDVYPDTIDTHSTCSVEVAEQMVVGCQKQFEANVAVAITGEAGPVSQSGLPCGTICFAWLIEDTLYCETQKFNGKRSTIRTASVAHAIQRLKDFLEQALLHLVQH